MNIDVRRLMARPSPGSYIPSSAWETAKLKRDFGLSTDVARRIVLMSRTMDQAHAIAELMK